MAGDLLLMKVNYWTFGYFIPGADGNLNSDLKFYYSVRDDLSSGYKSDEFLSSPYIRHLNPVSIAGTTLGTNFGIIICPPAPERRDEICQLLI